MTNMTQERADLLETLAMHRALLRQTAQGLTDEQARLTPTVSVLSVGGVIKHVAEMEHLWAQFMVDGGGLDVDWSDPNPQAIQRFQDGFRLVDGETLAGVLADYERIAAATDELVRTLDLDHAFPLPVAPWFPPGATRSVRRVVTHLVAETAQHAGHADILRESIDGAKTMG